MKTEQANQSQNKNKKNNAKPALAALSLAGIEWDYSNGLWNRVVQGTCEVDGCDGPMQTRVTLSYSGEEVPQIDLKDEKQAVVLIDWFDEKWSKDSVMERAGAQASKWMLKAQSESAVDVAKLAKTLGKLLSSGHRWDEFDESLHDAFAQWSANWRIKRQAGELEIALSLNAYPLLFPMARSLRREVEIFTGPTNSGKTYAGMQLLAKAKSGAYLAPLRLLALEGQEAMQERGLSCSLVTGEERRIKPGDQFVASTVEMADFNTAIDVAVIDEAQMLADKDRGWAWTAAICGMPAKKLAIVCAPEAVEMVQKLLERAGESCVVHRFERKNPLEAQAQPMSFGQLKSGDALIAFSRKNALAWRDKVVAAGNSVAVIYGALAPEVRRGEAKKFADGHADILVATDAIGMGLNLPIKRIVFTTTTKFDGQETRTLGTQELRQIAGRAGRYGIAEKGIACTMDAEDSKVLCEALASGVHLIDQQASIAPNDRQIQQMSAAMGTDRLGAMLGFFRDHLVKSDAMFKASGMEDMMELAWRADRRLGLPLDVRFGYSKTPLDRNDLDHLKVWEGWMRAHEQGKTARAPVSAFAPKSSRDDDKLWEYERAMKLLSAYCWLSWRFEEVFSEREMAEAARLDYSEKIEGLLNKMSSSKSVHLKAGSTKLPQKKGGKFLGGKKR